MLWTTFWKQVPAPTAFTQGLNSSLVFSAIPLPIPFKFATWRQRQHFPRDNLGAAEWLKLSSLISIQRCSIKNALMQWSVNELGNTLPSLTQLMLPFSWTRPWELSRPPVCRSSAWGLHFTLTPAFPQKGLLPLTSSLWHCWHCDFFCVWFEFYSSLSCMPSVSLASIVWNCCPQPGSRRHPLTSRPSLCWLLGGITCCWSFFPQALPV